jgi:hypothetical protein
MLTRILRTYRELIFELLRDAYNIFRALMSHVFKEIASECCKVSEILIIRPTVEY